MILNLDPAFKGISTFTFAATVHVSYTIQFPKFPIESTLNTKAVSPLPSAISVPVSAVFMRDVSIMVTTTSTLDTESGSLKPVKVIVVGDPLVRVSELIVNYSFEAV